MRLAIPTDKFCPPEHVATRLLTLPRPLVMTNGVFDVLHRGHVSYLQRAAELGGSLLVALNTDRSAKMLSKGPERPLNSADDRAYVLAGLGCVDVVTFFDNRTPVELIRTVRPDIYVKGGDYDMEALEETKVVRSWGGQSLALPFLEGFSTTALVQRIRTVAPTTQGKAKAAFLDRDGVINRDQAYVHRWEDFEFMPGAIEAMRRLQQAGYALVVVTNQSGLARGYYSEEQYQALSVAMRQALAGQGITLAGIYHCPHHPAGVVAPLAVACDCRKPAPGLLLRAAQELQLSLADSLLIGDKASDIEAARAAGVGRAYLVDSDNPENPKNPPSGAGQPLADGHFADLWACTTQLLGAASQETTP